LETRLSWRTAAAAFACVISFCAQAARTTQWTIIDLGGLGTSGSSANSINDHGAIVGSSYVVTPGQQSGNNHAFLWQNGVMRDLGTPNGSPFSTAVAVNDRTEVLVADYYGQAWLWKDESWTLLGVHGPADINNKGAVTGTYFAGRGMHSYLFQNGVMHDLGSLGGNDTFASGMNAKGAVVGTSSFAPNGWDSRGFIYQDGIMTDLGTLGGANSTAADVNSHGVVVGASQDAANGLKSFIWESGRGMRLLFDQPGTHYASGINDKGAVIGLTGSGSYLYDDGVLTVLESIPQVAAAGWSRLYPADINNHGWITGVGNRADGSMASAFVLIPR
jgi:probable HAF family extracellular repeat protein